MSASVTRSAWSCENCRRRKVRCDGGDPCAHCRRRDETCNWPENAKSTIRPLSQDSKPSRAAGSLDAGLAERVARIESVLRKAGILEAATGDTPGKSPGLVGSARPSRNQEVSIRHLVDTPEGGTLQHDVHLHDDFDHHIIGASPEEHQKTPKGATGSFVRGPLVHPKVRALLAEALPEQPLCDQLVSSYFRHVEWIHHTLHEPKFMSEYSAFWSAYNGDGPIGVELDWLAVLMIILCLGSHFHPRTPASEDEEMMYMTSHEFLRLSDCLESQSINAVQTLMLMGLWLNDRGRGKTHHAQLAVAIRMATNMGLSKMDANTNTLGLFSRDDAEFFSIAKQPLACVRDSDHEISRRLWWSLVCQDYYTASSCNFTYTVNPRQCKTHQFLNLDEDELFSESTAVTATGHPLSELATSASYHLLKIPFTHVAKAMVDLYNDDDFSYASVLKLDGILWATYQGLPSFFKWRSSDKLEHIPSKGVLHPEHLGWQRLFLGFTVHNRVLRLHRPFMVKGYVDENMAYSRRSTINSALACLQLAEHGLETDFPGLRWWVILIHIFTSGVALCIDLHFLLQQQSLQSHGMTVLNSLQRSISTRRAQIDRIIALLRPASASSVAAARGISALEGLIGQAERSVGHSREDSAENSRPYKRPRTVTMADSTPMLDQVPAAVSVSSNVHPPTDAIEDEWLASVSLDDWTGPDWDELFDTLAYDGQHSQAEASADIFEAMTSFANGYA